MILPLSTQISMNGNLFLLGSCFFDSYIELNHMLHLLYEYILHDPMLSLYVVLGHFLQWQFNDHHTSRQLWFMNTT